MSRTIIAFAAAAALTTLAAAPALAQHGGGGGGGSGGDREPAGGAFNSSYLAPGTTGVQDHGPPRSVDIPRPGQPCGYYGAACGGSYYGDPDATGSIGPARRYRRW